MTCIVGMEFEGKVFLGGDSVPIMKQEFIEGTE